MGRSQVENTTTRFTQEFLALDRDRKPITRLIRSRPAQFLSIDAGELSDLTGIDVAFPWRRMDQRQLIGFSQPFFERDIADAFTSEFEGNAGSSMMFLMIYNSSVGQIQIDPANSRIFIGEDLYQNIFDSAGWPTHLANGNGFVELTETSGGRDVSRHIIVGLDSKDNANDVLRLVPAPVVPVGQRRFVRVVGFRNYDRRGIFMSNGRRIFQFSSSSNTELLRIKDGAMGDRVRGARISNNRFLFVSPQYPPRLATLPNESNNFPIIAFTGATYDDTAKTITKSLRFVNYKRVVGDVVVVLSGTDITAGVYPITGSTGDTLSFATDTSLGVGGATADIVGHVLRRIAVENRFAGPLPPFGLGINPLGPGKAITLSTGGSGRVTAGTTAVRVRVFDLDTNSASAFYQAGTADPLVTDPDAFEVTISDAQDGVLALTVHFERRANKDQFVAFDRRSHVVQIFRKLSAGATYHMEVEIPLDDLLDLDSGTDSKDIDLILEDEFLKNKAQLLTSDSIKGVPPACKDIAILASTGTVLLAGKADVENFKHPVVEGIPFKWPLIDNDNVVHLSRVDDREPENFQPLVRATTQLEISVLGDKFQRFATAGNTVVAVMSRGVYFFEGGGPFGVNRRVVAESGLGTPWPESVISVERFAFWVTPNNCYLFNPEEPDIEDQLIPIGATITEWLRDAFELGNDVQAAYDQRRRVIVVRRITDQNTVQDWEYHITTGNSTFVDDRTGLVYVSATSANVAATSKDRAILYSVDHSGQVLEIGRRIRVGDILAYDAGTIQDVLDGGYTIDDEAISQAVQFPLATLGDSVRFRSTNPAVDGQVRKITELVNLGTKVSLGDSSAATNRIGLVFLSRHLGLVAWSKASETRVQPVQFIESSTGVVDVGTMYDDEIGNATEKGHAILAVSPNEAWVMRGNAAGLVVQRFTVNENETAIRAHGDPEAIASAQVIDTVELYKEIGGIVAIGTRKAMVFYTQDKSPGALFVMAISRDEEGVFSSGPKRDLQSSVTVNAHDLLAIGDDKALAIYHNSTNADIRAQVLSVTGLTITDGTALTVSSVDFGDYASALGRIDDNSSVVLYRTATGVDAAILSHTLTTITKTGAVTVTSAAAIRIYKVLMVSSNKGVFCWHDSVDNKIKLQGFRISGSTITVSGNGSINLLPVGNATTHAINMAVVNVNNFVIAYRDPADSDNVKILDGLIYDSDDKVTVSNFGLRFAFSGLVFDAVPGLAEGDEFMIGAVPLRMKFAPIVGDRTRNGKRLDGVSVWAKPSGRNATTTKKLQLHVYRNFDTAREKLNYADDTELEIAIKAPSEVSAVDEDLFLGLAVEGKAIELELENLDTDTGIELVNVAGIVKETGDLTEDRDTAT